MRHLLLPLASLLLLPAAAVHADTFTISVTANGTTNTGTVTGNSIGNGAYLITSVSGSSIVGFPGNDPVTVDDPATSLFGADNLFYPDDPRLFDVNGIEISGVFGTANLFLFNGGPNFSVQGIDPSGDFYNAFPVSVTLANSTATPEPSSLLLSFTGLAAAGALLLRKRSLFTTAPTAAF